MDPDRYLPLIPPVLALLATNAFFVIAEYAILTLQRGRLEFAARISGLGASVRPDEALLLAQLGRSVSTLGLGYALARLGLAGVAPGDPAGTTTLVLTLLIGAVIHALLSAHIPKLVAMHYANGQLVQFFVTPVRLFTLVLRPLIWPLTRVVNLVSGWAGVTAVPFPPLAHTPDEIRILVSQGHEQGVVEEDEREMIDGVFEFTETVAREVMTPRIDIVAVTIDSPLETVIDRIVREGHSRLPVYEGTIDSVAGVLLAKDLLPLLTDPAARDTFDIRRVMREPYFVPDTKPVDDILAEFRQQSVHLAIVLDEFGGTYGLLTMEDLLEEIVGEITDEYDVAEEPEFSATPEGDVLIDGGAALSEVNDRFKLALPEEDFDTLGGFIFGSLGRIPIPGDEISAPGDDAGYTLHVEAIEDRRVTRVRLTRAVPAEEA
jgi:putative hemolysin